MPPRLELLDLASTPVAHAGVPYLPPQLKRLELDGSLVSFSECFKHMPRTLEHLILGSTTVIESHIKDLPLSLKGLWLDQDDDALK